VPINAVFFRHFKEGPSEYLTRTWLIDPNQVEAQASKAPVAKRGKEPWNGKDFYVSIGEGESRNWEDCRRYGFVAAGGDRWYSTSLHQLSPGSRVFACIPKRGYVGVGTVIGSAVPVRDFAVSVDGVEKPVLDVDLVAPSMDHDADDPESSEYLVRIE